MPIALQGALVGFGVAVFLYMFEYLAIKSAAAARAKKMAKKVEILQEERSRLRGVMMFCFCLPPGMAIIFWLTMG